MHIDIEPEGGGGDQRRRMRQEAVDRRRRRRFKRSIKRIIDTTVSLGGQAIGAVVGVALTRCTHSFPLYVVEIFIVFGLSFIFAALSLSWNFPNLSVVTAKIGAVTTAAAIVIAVISHLPPLLAFAAGPFAFLVISVAVAFAS